MNLSIRNESAASAFQNSIFHPRTSRGVDAYPLRPSGAAPPSGSTAANSQLEARLQSTMKEQFATAAKDPRGFHDLMQKVYGAGYDHEKAEGLRQKALAGDFSWLPPVKLLDSQTLHGANGAYDAKDGVVFINADLAAKDPKLAASTYVEEAGAHIDTLLNKSDTVGDEGEMFRRLLSGEKLSAAQVKEIRSDDDRGTITVNGQQVAVEFWNPFSSIKKAVKGVGSAIKSAASHVKNAVKDFGHAIKETGSKFMDRMMNAGSTLFSGFGKMTFGFAKNLFTGHVGDAFKSFFKGLDDSFLQFPKQLVRGAIDSVHDAANAVTQLLPGAIGSFTRTILGKGFDFVGSAFDHGFDKLSNVLTAITNPVTGFASDLENSVRLLLNGDFKEAAKLFGKSFLHVPKRLFSDLVTAGGGETPDAVAT